MCYRSPLFVSSGAVSWLAVWALGLVLLSYPLRSVLTNQQTENLFSDITLETACHHCRCVLEQKCALKLCSLVFLSKTLKKMEMVTEMAQGALTSCWPHPLCVGSLSLVGSTCWGRSLGGANTWEWHHSRTSQWGAQRTRQQRTYQHTVVS